MFGSLSKAGSLSPTPSMSVGTFAHPSCLESFWKLDLPKVSAKEENNAYDNRLLVSLLISISCSTESPYVVGVIVFVKVDIVQVWSHSNCIVDCHTFLKLNLGFYICLMAYSRITDVVFGGGSIDKLLNPSYINNTWSVSKNLKKMLGKRISRKKRHEENCNNIKYQRDSSMCLVLL